MKRVKIFESKFLAVIISAIMIFGTCEAAFANNAIASYTPSVGAGAKIYYMAPNGNDGNTGSYNQPFATFDAALTALQAGDILYVRGGVYKSAGTVNAGIQNKNGDENNWFTVLNYPGETPQFDGEWSSRKGSCLVLLNCSYWHIEGLEILNYQESGISVQDSNHMEFVNLKIHDITNFDEPTKQTGYDGMSVWRSNNILVDGCAIYDVGWNRPVGYMYDHGIYISNGGSNWTIRNSYFHDIPSGSAIHVYGAPGATDNLFENNLVVKTAMGIVLGSKGHDNTVRNNTFYHNKMSDIYVTEGAYHNTIECNIFGPMLPHDTKIASYHVYFPLLDCLYNSFDNNFYDNGQSSNSTYIATIENWVNGNTYSQKVGWDVWTNTAETTEDYQSKYYEDKYNGNTSEQITGLGMDANGQTGEVRFTDPDNGDFSLSSDSDCQIQNVGAGYSEWAPLAANTPDLILVEPNFGFESDLSVTWTQRLFWASSNDTIDRVTDAYAGDYSAHINNTLSSGAGQTGLGTDFRISVKPSTTYTITAKVKTLAGAEAAASIFFDVGQCTESYGNIHDSNNVDLGNAYTQIGTALTGPKSEWTTLSATFTTDDETGKINLRLWARGMGDFYFDDVNLSETATVPTESNDLSKSIVKNPGFEDSFVNTWTQYKNDNGGTIEQANAQFYSGSKSMHIGNTDDVATGLRTDFRVKVDPNTTYQVSVKVKTSAETQDTATIYLDHSECTPAYQHEASWISGDGRTPVYVQFGDVLTGPQTTWKTINATFTTGQEAGCENIGLWGSGIGDFYFDHVIITPVGTAVDPAVLAAQESAVSELNTNFDSYSRNDYYPWQWTDMQEICKNGLQTIRSATSQGDVATALTNAKNALSAIKISTAVSTELADEITNARTAVDAYANPADYREPNQEEVQKLQRGTKQLIAGTDSEQRINDLVQQYESLVDALKTNAELTVEELAAAKAKAVETLQNYAPRTDYSLANWTLVRSQVISGTAAINAAADAEAVKSALAVAEAAIDAIPTTAEEAAAANALAKAKEDAENTLLGYATKSNYTSANWALVEKELNKGSIAIDAATSTDMIGKTLESTKKTIDEIQMISQNFGNSSNSGSSGTPNNPATGGNSWISFIGLFFVAAFLTILYTGVKFKKEKA